MTKPFACLKDWSCLCVCSEMLESNGKEDYVADSEDEGTKNFKVRVRAVRCWTWTPRRLRLSRKASTLDFAVHDCVIHSFTRWSFFFVDSLWLHQLFTKRYYKTKHGTYVPTLREYWKPGAARKDLLSVRSKRRWWAVGVFPCQVQSIRFWCWEMQQALPRDIFLINSNYYVQLHEMCSWIKIMFLKKQTRCLSF